MEAEIETGLGGDDVERVGGGEIGSMELLDVDECFGVCHLNCRYSDTSVCTHYRCRAPNECPMGLKVLCFWCKGCLFCDVLDAVRLAGYSFNSYS